MHLNFVTTAVVLLALHAGNAVSHTWIEVLEAVGPGTKGYMRSWMGKDGSLDTRMTYRIEGSDWENKPICKDTQQVRANQPGFPRLRASRKQTVVGYYLENGHVSLPPPSATAFTGYTYWFGTTDPDPKLPLGEVRAWTLDGQGGNKKGRLLAAAPYDDGVCTQPNPSPISQQRGVGKEGVEKPCRSEFVIPENLKVGDVYTVYWVWDFSWHFGRDKPRVEEWYTSCMDIEII